MWNTISNNPLLGLLAQDNREKAWTGIVRRGGEGHRLPDCWCHLEEPASRGFLGGQENGQAGGGVTKKSLGHRVSLRTLLTGGVSPRAAVTEERPRTDSFKALPSLALDARRHFWPQESNTKKTRKLDGKYIFRCNIFSHQYLCSEIDLLLSQFSNNTFQRKIAL